MQKTKLIMMIDYPFFGSLALNLELIKDTTIPTLNVDGKRIRYNPDFTDTLSRDEKLFCYLHEIGHVILGHSLRREDRNFYLWNIACDYAVNLLLSKSTNLPIIDGSLINQKYDEWSAERIYEFLANEYYDQSTQVKRQPQSQSQSNQSGQSDQSGSKSGSIDIDTDPTDSADQGSSADQDQDSESGQDSNPAQNQDQDQNQNQSQPQQTPDEIRKEKEFKDLLGQSSKTGQVVDADPDDALTEEEIKATTTLIDRITEACNPGTTSPAVKKLIYDFTDTSVPWKDILSRFIYDACQNAYDWMRPNRRYMGGGGVMMPSLYSQDELNIAIAVDTSGSIDRYLLSKFMSEFKALVESIEYKKITTISCSTQIYSPKEYHKGEDINYKPAGGGGTDFRPVFDYISKQDEQPVCLIYFTDLECRTFGLQPEYPVLWIGKFRDTIQQALKGIDNYWSATTPVFPPFGEVVEMKE